MTEPYSPSSAPTPILSHASVWAAIDRLAHSVGRSTSGLAKIAGLDATSFNRSKRFGADGKPRWPSTESLARILSATNLTMSDFMLLMDGASDHHPSKSQSWDIPIFNDYDPRLTKHITQPEICSVDTLIELPDQSISAIDHLRAIEITNNLYEDYFPAGTKLIINLDTDIRRKDFVALAHPAKKKSASLILARFIIKTKDHIEIASLTGKSDKIDSLNIDAIAWLARIDMVLY
jgi:hypothetical protein